MKRAVFATLCALLMAPSAWASTITITSEDVGESFSVTASGVAEDGGETVSVLFEAIIADYIIAATTTTLVLDITLTNTSEVDSELRAYGFSADPNVQTGTATGSEYGFDIVSTLLSTNNSVGNVENCVADQVENQCTGASSGGLASGLIDTHTLTLLFNGALESLKLGDIDTGMYFRFMSVGVDGESSAKIFGNPPATPREVEEVPDGGSAAALLGSVLLAFGMFRRRFV